MRTSFDYKSDNLRSRVLAISQFRFLSNFSESFIELITKLFSLTSEVNNGTQNMEELNSSLFERVPELWLYLAIDNSIFGESVFKIINFFKEFLEIAFETTDTDVEQIKTDFFEVNLLWELKDRTVSVHKNFRLYQDYYERIESNLTNFPPDDMKSYFLIYITTLQRMYYESLGPIVELLEKLKKSNYNLIRNSVVRNRIRSNYLSYRYDNVIFNYRFEEKILESIHNFKEPSKIAEVLSFCSRLSANFFWGLEASIDDMFKEIEYWNKLTLKEDFTNEKMLTTLFEPYYETLLPKKIIHVWYELRKCYKIKAFSACSILLRKFLESILWDNWLKIYHNDTELRDESSKKPKHLKFILEAYKKERLIGHSMLEQLKNIKFFGDINAHDFKIYNSDESAVITGLQTIKALIDHLYFGDEEDFF